MVIYLFIYLFIIKTIAIKVTLNKKDCWGTVQSKKKHTRTYWRKIIIVHQH